jgi:hypothetical protein
MKKDNSFGIWRFCVIGTIIREHLDETGALTDGSESFPGGTLVVLGGKGWDFSEEVIGVIGVDRYGQLALDYVPIQFIERIRCKRVYNPGILIRIDQLECLEDWPWWDQDNNDYLETKAFVKKITSMRAEQEQAESSDSTSSDDSETVLPMLSEAPPKTIHIVIRQNEKKPETKSSTPTVKANQGSEHEENSGRLKKWFRLLKRSKS